MQIYGTHKTLFKDSLKDSNEICLQEGEDIVWTTSPLMKVLYRLMQSFVRRSQANF